MKPPPLKRPPGRPRNPGKAEAILDAGWALFLARGVEATSIEAIAARAGVSKVTLYSHFPDRNALFEAAVLREMERIERAQGGRGADPSMPVVDALQAFGLGIMTFLASEPAIDFYTVLAGELRRHAELAQSFYDLGPGRTLDNLASLLQAAMTRGELIDGDAHQAAEDLFGLWQGCTNFQFSLGVDVDEILHDLPHRVAHGISVFMRTYGPAVGG